MARYDIINVSKKDLVNKITEFEKFVKLPHAKKEPKHEPTSSYLHLVKCLRKCIMRSGDHKQNVHYSYEKETALSSDVMDTDEDNDEDESDRSIAQSFDEPLSEDQDSISDHNYVNATTELNNEDDIKPSANHKKVSYFNIFEYGRNLLDKLNPCHRAFAASEKIF